MATPKPTRTLRRVPTGKDAINEYQKQISPKGMAEAEAAAKKALEQRYPGMFLPETRTTAGMYRSR
jgi:hypothetical protein